MKKLFLFSVLLLSIMVSSNLSFAQSSSIKYIFNIDYPMNGKSAYLDWVKSIVNTLQKPDELVSIASYENYFNESPQRIVEYEFANNLDAAKYFDNPEMRNVLDQVLDKGIVRSLQVLRKRSDYNPAEVKRSKIKYVYTLDYGVGNRTAYLDMVKTVVKTLQTPKEVKRITSYDNYFNESPNRVIEFEFDSMEDAVKYFDMPEVKSVIEHSTDISINHKMSVLRLRGDYNKN